MEHSEEITRHTIEMPEMGPGKGVNTKPFVGAETAAQGGAHAFPHGTIPQPCSRDRLDVSAGGNTAPFVSGGSGTGLPTRHRSGCVLKIGGERYHLEEHVHTSPMSRIWRASNLRTGTQVAIKITPVKHAPTVRAETFSELKKLSAHPGLVTCIRHVIKGESLYQILEWLDGQTLTARVAGPHATDAATIDRWLREVGSAIDALHSAGFVHGDIKLDNVMIVGNSAYLIDLVGLRIGAPWIRRGGLTPAFASHEAAAGAAADIRDDVYSFAVTVVCCASGRSEPPQEGIDLSEAAPTTFTESQWATLRTALDPRREQRIASISELLDGLWPDHQPDEDLPAAAPIVLPEAGIESVPIVVAAPAEERIAAAAAAVSAPSDDQQMAFVPSERRPERRPERGRRPERRRRAEFGRGWRVASVAAAALIVAGTARVLTESGSTPIPDDRAVVASDRVSGSDPQIVAAALIDSFPVAPARIAGSFDDGLAESARAEEAAGSAPVVSVGSFDRAVVHTSPAAVAEPSREAESAVNAPGAAAAEPRVAESPSPIGDRPEVLATVPQVEPTSLDEVTISTADAPVLVTARSGQPVPATPRDVVGSLDTLSSLITAAASAYSEVPNRDGVVLSVKNPGKTNESTAISVSSVGSADFEKVSSSEPQVAAVALVRTVAADRPDSIVLPDVSPQTDLSVQPAINVLPELPNRPEVPALADVPARPDAPGRPDIPGRPDAPGRPEVAMRPDVPNRPDVPARPDVPNRPDVPARPDVPNRPDVPARPDVPNRPDVPARPDVPNRPDVPARPDVPNRPDVPARPDVPNRPDVAARPDIPRGRPDIPPGRPDVPRGRPDVPGRPNVPGFR